MRKQVYTWKSGNTTFRRVFAIGNYAKDFYSAKIVADLITKDFPSIGLHEVEIGVITQSPSIKGYRLATALVPEDATIPPGWEDCGENMDFRWD